MSEHKMRSLDDRMYAQLAVTDLWIENRRARKRQRIDSAWALFWGVVCVVAFAELVLIVDMVWR